MDWNQLLSEIRMSDLETGIQQSQVTAFSDQVRPNDARSEFMRDYDRAVFSTPVRRLQDKTQVFPMETHDAVRTRLTHSLEVSTVARDIGREIGNWLYAEKHAVDFSQSHHIETIAATCALIHDLGNPPFGHAGELAIADWFRKRSDNDEAFFAPFGKTLANGSAGIRKDNSKVKNKVVTSKDSGHNSQRACDFIYFDGNAQTLRLVTRLQILSKPYGLNLTCGTLSAACKYTAESHRLSAQRQHIHESEKPGFFHSEAEIVAKVRRATGTGSARNPITYLVEASDDIVYSVVDIEDAIKSGVTTWRAVTKAVRDYIKNQKEEGAITSDLFRTVKAHFSKILGKAKDQIADGAGWFSATDRDEAISQAFRIGMIFDGVRKTVDTFKERYDAIIAGEYHNELLYDDVVMPEHTILLHALKSAARSLIYRSPKVLRLEIAGRRVIHDLMDLFWEGAQAMVDPNHPPALRTFSGKLYRLTSKNYRRVFEADWPKDKAGQHYRRMRLITDYICGMTDGFACDLHSRLTSG